MINSTESPTSVTYSLITPSGFPILFTMRDDKVNELIIKMETLEPSLLKKGYKAQEKKTFGSSPKAPVQFVEGKVCPKCGKPLVVVNNDKMISKCSDNRYNPVTKRGEPCDYVEWRDLR